MGKSIRAIFEEFNVAVRTDYNRAYQAVEPKLKEMVYEYPSGPVDKMNFVLFKFLDGMNLFTGTRTYKTFPEGWSFYVENKEYDMGISIKQKDFERAALMGSIDSLNIYKKRISELPTLVKDHPIELALDLLEAGDASTYGTTFDAQNFFDTTHDFADAAGTQSNIITNGSGVTTVAYLLADLQRAKAVMNGFYYQQGGSGNSKKRKLNRSMDKLVVVCPDQLFALFEQLRTQTILATGESNPVVGTFTLVSRPMTDANDWYLLNISDPIFKPFLYQVEKPVELDTPTMQDESVRNNREFQYGAYGRYAVAYGAWWTGVMVQNS
jgi:phage major head subunit gpT-like protein